MHTSPNLKCPQRPSQGGFALVIALSLMAFVLLLLLSITTLVQVESQSAAIHMHRMQAEQSALLGLQIALGELQKTAGPDQRVTATAQSTWRGRGQPSSSLGYAHGEATKIPTG
jgi:type II secretory pathway component PulK